MLEGRSTPMEIISRRRNNYFLLCKDVEESIEEMREACHGDIPIIHAQYSVYPPMAGQPVFQADILIFKTEGDMIRYKSRKRFMTNQYEDPYDFSNLNYVNK